MGPLRAYGAAAVGAQGELGLGPNVPGGGFGARGVAAPGPLLRGACGSAVRATASYRRDSGSRREKPGGSARQHSWHPNGPVYETALPFSLLPPLLFWGVSQGALICLEKRHLRQQRRLFLCSGSSAPGF